MARRCSSWCWRDLRAKSEAGARKYGGPLRTRNGRMALVDAYQEQLDLVMYLRQQLEEYQQVAAQARAALPCKRRSRPRRPCSTLSP